MKRNGFTLIEMLASIGIMMLLASLILVGLNAARRRARVLEAQQAISQIEMAWLAFLADHHEFPFSGSGTAIVSSDRNMLILRGGSRSDFRQEDRAEYRDRNLRGTNYYDIHPYSEGVRDPWGNFYRMAFDVSGNGRVSVGGEEIRKSVVVWSRGPDGQDFTNDDIRSWR